MTQGPKDGFLQDTSPLGKSVEEIEATTENRVNSSTPGEQRAEGGGAVQGVVPAVPVAATAGLGVGGGAAVGAALITEDLDQDGAGRQD